MGFLSRFRKQTKNALPLLLAGAIGASARPATAGETAGIEPQGVFAAAADNPGAYGTHWHTTVWASQDVADDATLTLCAATNSAPANECHQYTLPRGEVVTIPNAWDGFSAAPPGGLVWRVDGVSPDQVALFSRTYTIAPAGQPGTLGQGVPAQRLPDDVPLVGKSQYVPLAARDGFRSNVGFFNSTGAPSDVKVRIRSTGGSIVAEQEYTLPGYGWYQITDIYNAFGVEPAVGEYAEVIQMTGERLAVYSSVVDNTSGDPTFFPAKTRYDGQQQLFIPVAAHLPGYNNTTWLTDVSYLNASTVNGSGGGFAFLKYNYDNHNNPPRVQTWNMASGEMVTKLDIVESVFFYDNTKGSLTVTPLDSHLIWSRTYNDRGTEGTFGQSLPAIRGDQPQITGSLEGILIGLSESTDPATGYRSGVGLLNTGTTPATFHLALYDNQGTLKGELDQDVPPLSLVQLDKVYRNVTSDDITNGRIIIRATTGQGVAYASIIDNQNGDASTEYATIINPTTGNHPPEFVGNDLHCDGNTILVDEDPKDGIIDSGYRIYIGSPLAEGCIRANDPDGDALNYSWRDLDHPSLPPGFSYNGNRWQWDATAPGLQPGYYQMQVTIADGRGGEVQEVQIFDIRAP